jgi:hypothetical protein
MRQGLSTSEAGKLGAIAAAETIAANKQKRIDDWNTNPKLCKFCNLPLTYENRRNNFCSQSCGAKFHNSSRGFDLAEDKVFTCLFCAAEFRANGTAEHKYCSRDCMMDFWWEDTKTQLLKTGVDNSAANRTGKKYLIELHEGKCQICKKSEWEGQPMPLVLDHISGNPYDNSLTNLRVICHNCNAQTPTFTGRNKGNGRVARAKRYKAEKELFNSIKADIVQIAEQFTRNE